MNMTILKIKIVVKGIIQEVSDRVRSLVKNIRDRVDKIADDNKKQ